MAKKKQPGIWRMVILGRGSIRSPKGRDFRGWMETPVFKMVHKMAVFKMVHKGLC